MDMTMVATTAPCLVCTLPVAVSVESHFSSAPARESLHLSCALDKVASGYGAHNMR